MNENNEVNNFEIFVENSNKSPIMGNLDKSDKSDKSDDDNEIVILSENVNAIKIKNSKDKLMTTTSLTGDEIQELINNSDIDIETALKKQKDKRALKKKYCDYCNKMICTQCFVRHLQTNKHKQNQKIYFDNLKFVKTCSRSFDEFVSVDKYNIMVDSKELKVRNYCELKYILKTKNEKIVLDRYEETGAKNVHLGIKYNTENEKEFVLCYKTKNNIVGKDVYLIDLNNNSVILIKYDKVI